MSVVQRIEERRAAPRVDSDLRAWLTEPSELGCFPGDEELLAPLFGRALSISETGVLIEVDEPICVGRVVKVTIEVSGSRLEVAGQVVRSTRVRRTERCFRLGIAFTDLDDRTLDALRREIRRNVVLVHLN